jgi:hypothetical protein
MIDHDLAGHLKFALRAFGGGSLIAIEMCKRILFVLTVGLCLTSCDFLYGPSLDNQMGRPVPITVHHRDGEVKSFLAKERSSSFTGKYKGSVRRVTVTTPKGVHEFDLDRLVGKHPVDRSVGEIIVAPNGNASFQSEWMTQSRR